MVLAIELHPKGLVSRLNPLFLAARPAEAETFELPLLEFGSV